MSARKEIAETEVAAPVAEWLRRQHWDVHQEVAPGGGGSARADIVGAQGRALYVVEAKVSFSLALVEQAMRWTAYAHFVSVAVPHGSVNKAGRGVLEFVCAHFGIGILTVSGLGRHRGYDGRTDVHVHRSPRLNRKALDHRLRKALCDETRANTDAGAKFSDYHTPFKRTCEAVARMVVGQSEPVTTRAIVEQIKHHYSSDASARGALPDWMRAGRIPGVVAVDGKPERWRWDDAHYRAKKGAA